MAKKFKISDYKLVCVEWNDAQDHETGWHNLSKAKKHGTCIVRSIGFIIDENDSKLTIAGDFILEDGETSRITAIPKDWCQKIIDLKPIED